MLHHAARVSKRTLLTCTSTPDPANVWPGSAFTTALRVAAARAWTRTAVRNLRNVSTPTSVTLEEENTAQTRKLSSAPSDSDTGSRLDRRRISPFACVDYYAMLGVDLPAYSAQSSSSAWVEDDPLVDSGESSSKATQPPTRSTIPIQPTTHPSYPAQQVDHPSPRSVVDGPHNSPETTESLSRTLIQKLIQCIPHLRGPAGLPNSTSSLNLLDNLDKWRKRPPKPEIASSRSRLPPTRTSKPPALNFETLHAHHARSAAFQTHQSFRVLVEIAINEAKFGAARRLWISMDRKGMLSDWDSLDDGGVSLWAVWARWMVRRGKWAEAWKTAQRWRTKMAKLSASELASEGLPHAIWIEFLGKAHKSVDRPPSSRSGSQKRSRLTDGRPPNAPNILKGRGMGLEEQHALLMRQPPHLNHSQMTNVRPRTIYALVRARLRLGDRKWSMIAIRHWFLRMGSREAVTDIKGNRACLRLLHLYLALAFPLSNGQRSAVQKGSSSVREMEAVVNELVKLNPRVKPNSTTVLLLLRHLRSTAKCADNGARLVARYKRLYGDGVDDERVRLRLARLAIKQNNPAVFRRALAPVSMPKTLEWNGVTLARKRARLLRERASWLCTTRSDGGVLTPKIGEVRGTRNRGGDSTGPPV